MTPLQFEPGSKYQYSNAGINTAGRIIEVVSGMPYEEFLDKRLFGPLGMKDTTFWPNEEQLKRLAKSYKPNKDKTGLEETHDRRSCKLSARRPHAPADAGRRPVFHRHRFVAVLPHDSRRRHIRGQTLPFRKIAATNDFDANRRPAGQLWLRWSADRKPGGPFGHGGAYSTNMQIDPAATHYDLPRAARGLAGRGRRPGAVHVPASGRPGVWQVIAHFYDAESLSGAKCLCSSAAGGRLGVRPNGRASGSSTFDDDIYVYDNPADFRRAQRRGDRWAFTHRHAGNWHPLTWTLPHAGLPALWPEAGGHHLTNVLLHAATAVLLFLVLRQMTGRFWPSALVAALFAVHPLHVESVAWVAERKDVLSGLFFVLTLAAYMGYVRQPVFAAALSGGGGPVCPGADGQADAGDAAVCAAAAGLLAAGTVSRQRAAFNVARLQWGGFVRRARTLRQSRRRRDLQFPELSPGRETPPAAGGRFCLATIRPAIMVSEHVFRFGPRIANALVSYVAYLGQFFYPRGLALFYPHPGTHLADLERGRRSGSCWRAFLRQSCARRQGPYLLVGWLWYLGMLVPAIGLKQVGAQAMADRYTYLPQIGIGIALVWWAADLCRSWPYRRPVCSVTSAMAADCFDRLCVASDIFLVRQRDLVDSQPGLHFVQQSGPQQPGRRLGRSGPVR